MENQLTKMDKAVIGSIILGILIVTSSLAYHWLISIPKKEAMQLKQQEIYTLEEKKNDENYEIVGEDGMALRIKFAQTNEDVISNLRAIMGSSALREQDIEYIDLRFGNRVYYKLD